MPPGHSAKIAYIILCHTNAPQVLRLARTIRARSHRARVVIRHNQPPGFLDDADAAAAGADLLVSAIPSRWGHWSLVEASVEAFRRARELHDPEWLVLISGQDYPIADLQRWENELLDGGHDAVMSDEPLVTGPFGARPGPPSQWPRMRYTHRWYWLPQLGVIPRIPPAIKRPLRRLWYRCVYPIQAFVVVNELPRGNGWALGIRRRTVPWSTGMPLYKGSQWVALSRAAADVTLDGPLADRLRRYFQTSLVPDEAFFQTVLENTAGIRVSHEPVSWLRWKTDVHPHPVVIDESELEQAMRASAPFARKFDEEATPGILDLVDRTLLPTPEKLATAPPDPDDVRH